MGINGCQGTLWSEELSGKELHGAAWWRVPSGAERIRFFPVHGANTAVPNIYKRGILLIIKAAMILHDPLYC